MSYEQTLGLPPEEDSTQTRPDVFFEKDTAGHWSPSPDIESVWQHVAPSADGRGIYINLNKQAADDTVAVMRHVAAMVTGTNFDYVFTDEEDPDGARREKYDASYGYIDPEDIQRAGKSIEFAGPTERREGLNMLPGFEPDIVTNVAAEPMGLGDLSAPDVLTDATNMPLADASVGSVHISCMPRRFGGRDGLRPDAISESIRVIKEGGYLVWDGGSVHDYDQITQAGLIPVATAVHIRVNKSGEDTYWAPSMIINGVFQKPPYQEASQPTAE